MMERTRRRTRREKASLGPREVRKVEEEIAVETNARFYL